MVARRLRVARSFITYVSRHVCRKIRFPGSGETNFLFGGEIVEEIVNKRRAERASALNAGFIPGPKADQGWTSNGNVCLRNNFIHELCREVHRVSFPFCVNWKHCLGD